MQSGEDECAVLSVSLSVFQSVNQFLNTIAFCLVFPVVVFEEGVTQTLAQSLVQILGRKFVDHVLERHVLILKTEDLTQSDVNQVLVITERRLVLGQDEAVPE